MESHLDGFEFACEAFIQNRKIRFLNISEYVTLGYSVFVPASPELEKWRPRVKEEIEKLIDTFDIDFGFIHPEYFVTSDGKMHFGEVAYRPPGFNVFELMERAYGFNAYQGLVLMFDPKTTEEEIEAFSRVRWSMPRGMPDVSASIPGAAWSAIWKFRPKPRTTSISSSTNWWLRPR